MTVKSASVTTRSTAQARDRLRKRSLLSVLAAHEPAFQGGEGGAGESGKDSASLSLSALPSSPFCFPQSSRTFPCLRMDMGTMNCISALPDR